MGKILLNGVDYSAPKMSEVTGIKGNAENTYRKGNVNLTPANIGALSINGNAVSATRAEQDGNGNNIADTYVKKTDALTGDYLPLSGGFMNKGANINMTGSSGTDTSVNLSGGGYDMTLRPDELRMNSTDTVNNVNLNSRELVFNSANSNTHMTYQSILTTNPEKRESVYVDYNTVQIEKCTDNYDIQTELHPGRIIISNATDEAITISGRGTSTEGSIRVKDTNSGYTSSVAPAIISVTNSTNNNTCSLREDGIWLNNKRILGAGTASHTHDDRYYTETEVDALLKNIMPPCLDCIQTGHFMYSGTETFDKVFFSTNSTYKRSLCLLTSLYITIPNKNTEYHSQYREVAVHMIDWADVEYDTWSKIAHTNKLITSSSNTQSVSANNKHQWLHTRVNDGSSDKQLDFKFSMQSMLGGNNINGGTLYVSWAVIM